MRSKREDQDVIIELNKHNIRPMCDFRNKWERSKITKYQNYTLAYSEKKKDEIDHPEVVLLIYEKLENNIKKIK